MKIRNMVEADAEDLMEVLGDPDVMTYIEPPYSMEEVKDFIREAGMSESPAVYSAVNDEGEFVGYVIWHEYDDDSMEIGWLLKKKHWGKGYATALTKELVERTAKMGMNAVIECDPEQEITKKIALKEGFEYKGIEDDLCVYVKELKA